MIPVESFDSADQRQMRVSLRYGPLTRLVPAGVFWQSFENRMVFCSFALSIQANGLIPFAPD